MKVGETKTITATMEPVVAGAKCVWDVVDLDDPADEGYATVTPDAEDPFKATVKAVKEGGGRIQATVTAGGKSAKDSSRLGVEAGKPTPTGIEIVGGAEQEVLVGREHTMTVNVLPPGTGVLWHITEAGDYSIAEIQVDGAYLVAKGVKPGTTSATVAVVGYDNLTATVTITVKEAVK